MLAGEAHLGAMDDWRRGLISARDTLILIWIAWVALQGFGGPPFTPWILLALSVALSLLVGMSTARSTMAQVQHYAAELDRERTEIREHPQHERDEVQALYEAKGFREPLLSQIVDTLTADDDRLLKVMMEEELGLSMHANNHPLVVGVWNASSGLVAGLALALPLVWLPPEWAAVWVIAGGLALLAILSQLASWTTQRSGFEFFSVALVIAVVTGGVVYFLSEWLRGFVPIPPHIC